MEKVDCVDETTPIYGGKFNSKPPYVQGGRDGHPPELPYKEEGDGSSPFAPTKEHLNRCFFYPY